MEKKEGLNEIEKEREIIEREELPWERYNEKKGRMNECLNERKTK